MTAAVRETTKGLKMRDVMKATGLPRSTILHYVAEGLLPEPTRSARNVATYSPDCVERVRFIRALQKYKRLTLAEIRDYLSSGRDVSQLHALVSLADTVFGTVEGRRITRAELMESSGLSAAALHAVLEAGLLVPREEGVFDEEDVAVAALFARSLSRGLKARDFTFYLHSARELVDGEMELRERLVRGLDTAANAGLTEEMTRGARLYRSYIFERTFQRAAAGIGLRSRGGT